LSNGGDEDFKLVLDSDELTTIDGNAQMFVQALQKKGVFGPAASSPL